MISADAGARRRLAQEFGARASAGAYLHWQWRRVTRVASALVDVEAGGCAGVGTVVILFLTHLPCPRQHPCSLLGSCAVLCSFFLLLLLVLIFLLFFLFFFLPPLRLSSHFCGGGASRLPLPFPLASRVLRYASRPVLMLFAVIRVAIPSEPYFCGSWRNLQSPVK